MSFKERLKALIELVRVHNVINAGIAALTGYLVAGVAVGQLNLGFPMLLAVLVVSITSAGGYVINDYFDIEVDKVNKPERPLPSGKISLDTAYKLALSLFLTSPLMTLVIVLYDAVIGVVCTLFVVLHVFLMYYYSKTLKVLGFIGNLIVSFSSFSSILFGGLVYAATVKDLTLTMPSLIPAFYAFLIILAREIVKGIEDIEGDKVRHIQTLALKYGPKRAYRISLVPYFILLILSPIPYFYPIFNARYGVLYLILALFGVDLPATIAMAKLKSDPVKHASSARSLLKISLLIGPLAFILGSKSLISLEF